MLLVRGYDVSDFDITYPGGHSLIWPIRGRAAGQGMVFGLLCPEQGIQFMLTCPRQVNE